MLVRQVVRGLLEAERLRGCILAGLEGTAAAAHQQSLGLCQQNHQHIFPFSADTPAKQGGAAAAWTRQVAWVSHSQSRPKPFRRFYKPEPVSTPTDAHGRGGPKQVPMVSQRQQWSAELGRNSNQITILATEPESDEDQHASMYSSQDPTAAPTSLPPYQPVLHLYRQHQQQQQRQSPAQHQQQPPAPQQQQQQQQQLADTRVPVHAYFIGGEVDISAFLDANNLKNGEIAHYRDSVIIPQTDMREDTVLLGQEDQEKLKRFLVVYRFGCVIFFGSNTVEHPSWIKKVRQYTSEKLADDEVQHDETTVLVRSALGSWSQVEPDRFVVRALDVANMRLISQVLGQSVALDHYNRKVDRAIQYFTPYLSDIARNGESKSVNELQLLRLIGENSLLYTSVVSKLGLLDMSDTAWKSEQYYAVWQSLRKDYEIDRRFEALNRKLGPMLENAKFILSVREDRKTEASERTIIALIAVEILLHAATSIYQGW